MIYDAWGNVTYDYNEELDSLGMLEAMNIASINSIAYRGYFYDFETGLYYLQSRYYDPETGRFINADDTAYIGYDSSPISTNIFAYCANNPVKYSDDSGAYYYGSVGSKLSNSIGEMKRKFESTKRIHLITEYNPKRSPIAQPHYTYYSYTNYSTVVDGKRTTVFLNYTAPGPLRKRARIYVMTKEAWLLWYTKQNTNLVMKIDRKICNALGLSPSARDTTLDAFQTQTIFSSVAIGATLYSFMVSAAENISNSRPKYKFVYDICRKYKNRKTKIYILWALDTLDYQRIYNASSKRKVYSWVVSGSQFYF